MNAFLGTVSSTGFSVHRVAFCVRASVLRLQVGRRDEKQTRFVKTPPQDAAQRRKLGQQGTSEKSTNRKLTPGVLHILLSAFSDGRTAV